MSEGENTQTPKIPRREALKLVGSGIFGGIFSALGFEIGTDIAEERLKTEEERAIAQMEAQFANSIGIPVEVKFGDHVTQKSNKWTKYGVTGENSSDFAQLSKNVPKDSKGGWIGGTESLGYDRAQENLTNLNNASVAFATDDRRTRQVNYDIIKDEAELLKLMYEDSVREYTERVKLQLSLLGSAPAVAAGTGAGISIFSRRKFIGMGASVLGGVVAGAVLKKVSEPYFDLKSSPEMLPKSKQIFREWISIIPEEKSLKKFREYSMAFGNKVLSKIDLKDKIQGLLFFAGGGHMAGITRFFKLSPDEAKKSITGDLESDIPKVIDFLAKYQDAAKKDDDRELQIVHDAETKKGGPIEMDEYNKLVGKPTQEQNNARYAETLVTMFFTNKFTVPWARIEITKETAEQINLDTSVSTGGPTDKVLDRYKIAKETPDQAAEVHFLHQLFKYYDKLDKEAAGARAIEFCVSDMLSDFSYPYVDSQNDKFFLIAPLKVDDSFPTEVMQFGKHRIEIVNGYIKNYKNLEDLPVTSEADKPMPSPGIASDSSGGRGE